MSERAAESLAGIDLERLVAEQARSDERYREFLRVPSMSLGLYRLPAGGVDEQRPHGEDEVYYCLKGRARLRVGTDEHDVAPGSLHFVEKRVEHRFHSVTEELLLLVFFSPAEGSSDSHGA